MKSELILKRPDKSQVKITADFWADRRGFGWGIHVQTKGPGKRKWCDFTDTNDYSYRKLSMTERSEFVKASQLEVVTEEEILQAKMKLWESIKPVK